MFSRICQLSNSIIQQKIKAYCTNLKGYIVSILYVSWVDVSNNGPILTLNVPIEALLIKMIKSIKGCEKTMWRKTLSCLLWPSKGQKPLKAAHMGINRTFFQNNFSATEKAYETNSTSHSLLKAIISAHRPKIFANKCFISIHCTLIQNETVSFRKSKTQTSPNDISFCSMLKYEPFYIVWCSSDAFFKL